jgi:hypothetical protein
VPVEAFSQPFEMLGVATEQTDPNMNLRSYYPNFVAVEQDGTHWLLERKGHETPEAQRKDEAAQRWCEDATTLTGTQWRYLMGPQKQFEQLQAATLADLVGTSSSLL